MIDYKNINLFLFDMDGTIYLGDDLFPFTNPLLEEIKKQGKHYLFLTNNSSKSVVDYVKKLNRLGIEATTDEFLTSSQVTAMHLLKNYKDKRLYVMGTNSFKKELSDYGVNNIYDYYRDDIEVVVAGFDTELTFKKLEDVSRILVKDLPFIAANPDWVCPTEFGYVPDCGSVCKMITNATKREPFFIGKPRPEMPLFAIEKMVKIDPTITKETTMVVGDRLYTDVACGVNAKINSLLVLSGETTMEDVKNSDIVPDDILKDCGVLLDKIRG